MIGRMTRGTDARRLLYYLYRPGTANERIDLHLVAGFSDQAELEPERRPADPVACCGWPDCPPSTAALNGDNHAKPVWRCSIRTAPEDRLLSDAE
jgi:hypothetical protein